MITEITTWLPVFPGFRDTDFDVDDALDDEEYSYLLDLYGYPVANVMKGYGSPDLSSLFELGREAWHTETAVRCTDAVTDKLREILPAIKTAGMLDIESPREYNFTNDRITVEFAVDAAKLSKEVRTLLKEYARPWKTYLKERYKSRSGFHSFHPHTPEEWEATTKNYTDWNHYQHAGAVFDFLLWAVEDYGSVELFNSVERVSLEAAPLFGPFDCLPSDVRRFLTRCVLDLDDLPRQKAALWRCNPHVAPKMFETECAIARSYATAVTTYYEDGKMSKDVEDYVAICALMDAP